jgi:hypothetical protein
MAENRDKANICGFDEKWGNRDLDGLDRALSDFEIRKANGLDTAAADQDIVMAMFGQLEGMDVSDIVAQETRLEQELARLVPNPGKPSLGLFRRYYLLQQEYLMPGFLSDPPRLEMLSFLWSRLQQTVTAIAMEQNIPDPYSDREFGSSDYTKEDFWKQDRIIIEDVLRNDAEEVGRRIWMDDIQYLRHISSHTHLGFFNAEWEFNH